jgi:5-methylcytosine-specific restriction endonuclease McrA
MATRKSGSGGHWVRDTTRLAIYLRDGMACCYCGATQESGAQLSLDHLRPASRDGQNAPANLVTCCLRCNSSRGTRSVAAFARAVAEYRGTDAASILRHIRACARRALPRAEARELIARRTS